MKSDKRSIDTSAVHAGRECKESGFSGAAPGIEPSSAFVAQRVEELYGVFRGQPGVVYSRIGNPTVHLLARAVAELEGGEGAVAFGSGMAALHAAWLACSVKHDDIIFASRDCYGSTLTLLRDIFERLGVKRIEADLSDAENACRAIHEIRPKIVHCEIISNPLVRVVDFPMIAKTAHEVGARVVLDATFATPVLFRGLDHGADLVVHSLTKYLNGHGDVIGGLCVANDADILGGLKQAVTIAGAVLSPFDAWLTLRGLRTLPLRMRRHCENALQVATFLEANERVSRVHYPGLASHPQHEIARQLLSCGSFGGIVAFEIRNATRRSAMQFMNALKLVRPATTLGDVWSLAMYPPESSHRDLSSEELERAGISRGLIRLSVGIEDPEDIIDDLDQALGQT